MTDQKKQDHWGNLADNVGATPPPDDALDSRDGEEEAVDENENAQPEDADQSPIGWGMADSEANADVDEAAETPADDIEVIEISSRRVQAYRPKSGWDELANKFDLPPVEEPQPEDPPEEALDVIPIEVETATVDESQDVVDEGQTDTPPEDISALDEVADYTSDEQQQTSDEGPLFGADEFDALFDDSTDSEEDSATEDQGPSFEEAIEATAKEISKEQSTGKRRKKRRRRPRKTEGKEDSAKDDSAKDDSAKDDAAKDDAAPKEALESEIVSTADTGGFGAGLFGNAQGPDDASDVFTTDEELADATDVLEMSPNMPAEEESPQDESKEGGKKRGRRRRRRGSGKKKESAAETPAADETASQESHGEEATEKSDLRGSRKKRSDADSKDSGDERRGRGDRTSDDEEEKKAVSHRGIPSWDEAIESIIATNMENRSKKSGGGSSSRSRGGRGRGGKEKSGSQKRSK